MISEQTVSAGEFLQDPAFSVRTINICTENKHVLTGLDQVTSIRSVQNDNQCNAMSVTVCAAEIFSTSLCERLPANIYMHIYCVIDSVAPYMFSATYCGHLQEHLP